MSTWIIFYLNICYYDMKINIIFFLTLEECELNVYVTIQLEFWSIKIYVEKKLYQYILDNFFLNVVGNNLIYLNLDELYKIIFYQI